MRKQRIDSLLATAVISFFALVTHVPIDLATPDPWDDTSADGHHLRGHLAGPGLARLGDHLRSPAVIHPLQAMLRSGHVTA